MDIFLVHFALAFSVFFIVNWLGSHAKTFGYMQLAVHLQKDEAPAFNFVFRVGSPLVLLILISAGLYLSSFDRYTESIFMVNLYYFAIRVGWNLVMGRRLLVNWRDMAITNTIVVLLSYVLYVNILSKKQLLLPDLQNLANELWLIVILFVYQLFNKVVLPQPSTIARKEIYVKTRWAHLKAVYGEIVSGTIKNKRLEIFAYAIMIYEASSRPRIVRFLERLAHPFGLAKTIGLMQVQSAEWINDRESVARGLSLLWAAYTKALQLPPPIYEYQVETAIMRAYNADLEYSTEIRFLVQSLQGLCYPGETALLVPQTPPPAEKKGKRKGRNFA